MPTYQSTPEFEHGLPVTTGVLVVNLGTPEAPTTAAVRRFLKQFLSDPRVVEYPRLLWWLILNLIILTIRPSRSREAYAKIWTDEGSPLMIYSQAIASALGERLKDEAGDPIVVELAMTYGEPSVDQAIDRLLAAGARRILTVPLYPQYSGTTTAAVFDAVMRKMGKLRWIPEARYVNDYHDAPGYIDALATNIREYWSTNGRGEQLLMSFHGVPTSTLLKGDPYHCQCRKTARLLAEALELGDDEWTMSFQSRVGREEWLRPYTDETVRSLGAAKTARLDVVCPGFSTDCLETLEEIAMQNAEFFEEAGGGDLHYIPALNAREDHVDLLAGIVRHHILGWGPGADATERARTRERATAMGADK
jgi:ferrochelatase